MERITKDQIQQIAIHPKTFEQITKSIYHRLKASNIDAEEYGTTGIRVCLNGVWIQFNSFLFEEQIELKLINGYRMDMPIELLDDTLEIPFLQMIGG